jgi:hypothetical protein
MWTRQSLGSERGWSIWTQGPDSFRATLCAALSSLLGLDSLTLPDVRRCVYFKLTSY